MHLHEILRSQLAIAQAAFGPLRILETGTIRGETDNYATDDGWSTVCFAEWCKEHGGTVESIDLDISAAERVLEAKGFRAPDVLLHRAHSIEWLGQALENRSFFKEKFHGAPRTLPSLHFAYLDSDNDPTLILAEYLLAKLMMPPGAIVLVDDVDLSGTSGARKGHAIAPWLESHGQKYTIVGRQGQGYATGVLITRIP
jgi:predicted O-methyltransferase YrrM